MRQREQVVVVEAEQRAFQHDGKREIVLGHQQDVGERHQVLHRELLHQPHAVGAGDRHACRFSARIIGVVKGSRRRTRIRISPALTGRPFEAKLLAIGEPAL